MKYVYLIFTLFALLPSAAQAWTHKAHAVVADIATANLTPNAKAHVQALLKDDLDEEEKPSGRTTLAEVSSWADEIRAAGEDGAYKGWHVRANPVCSDSLGPCKNGNCVDQIIIHQTAILKDNTQTPRARNEALKWVVHLVGDLHMPLHSGNNSDGAGNVKVALVDIKTTKNPTLHTVWDLELSHLALKSGPVTAKLENPATLTADAPTQWMQEVRIVARKHVYDPLPGFACGTKLSAPLTLDASYQQQSIPVIREQIAKAGLRLAQLLNEALP